MFEIMSVHKSDLGAAIVAEGVRDSRADAELAARRMADDRRDRNFYILRAEGKIRRPFVAGDQVPHHILGYDQKRGLA